ncbi:MAG: LacI family DNA-binding transcriptional regulator [Emergencia sp.]
MAERDRNKQNTIYDISSKAGVSIATVSRVLNGSSKVSEQTKERVLQVIDECGYEPNAFARGLGTGSMRTIGILCADVADIYLANAVSFLERELRLHGFDTILNCTGYRLEQKQECMKAMEARRVDAVILVGSHYIENIEKNNRYIIDASARVPVMMLNGYLKSDNIYCNLSDDYTAFYDAAMHLISRGNRNILFLYREETSSMRAKYAGYQKALQESGLDTDPELVFQSGGKMEKIRESLTELSSRGISFDAVLAADDEMALAALKFAQKAGIRVPEELAVIGCNNSVLSICCSPELSSVDNKCEMLCINTVATLMRVLDGNEAVHKTVLSTEFIERGTTLKKER